MVSATMIISAENANRFSARAFNLEMPHRLSTTAAATLTTTTTTTTTTTSSSPPSTSSASMTNNFKTNISVISPHSDKVGSVPNFHLSKVKQQQQQPDSRLELGNEKSSIDFACSSYQPNAPKPPKKRYLENGHSSHHSHSHNDVLTRKHTSLKTNISTIESKQAHSQQECSKKDKVVPYYLDQDVLDRVIDNCYSDIIDVGSSSSSSDSNNKISPSVPQIHSMQPSSMSDSAKCFMTPIHIVEASPNMINLFNINTIHPSPTQVSTSISASLVPFQTQQSTINQATPQKPPPVPLPVAAYSTAPPSLSSSASVPCRDFAHEINTGDEQPVDFSMNRTITTNRQQIINNLVEKMLSESHADQNSLPHRIDENIAAKAQLPIPLIAHQNSSIQALSKNSNLKYTFSVASE